MRKWLLGAVLALAFPVAAQAQGTTPSPDELARAACKTEKSEMGTKTFKKTYVTKSVGKARKACLAKNGAIAKAEITNAAHTCKAERAADEAAFTEKYGTNKNKKNAYGKCVSTLASQGTEETTEDRVAAADTCKDERAADEAAFTEKYGTNKNKKNAFGKCVSKTAKEAEETEETEETEA